MPKQYISDVITNEEIAKWKQGNRILIHSQTGSGKSEFIKTKLYDYCKDNNKKILLLSNRTLLKKQNLADIKDKSDVIDTHNYQEFESKVLGGNSLLEMFKDFDYIIYDEAHYFYSDSLFNRNTNILIDPIINTPADKIFLFITATPDILLKYQPDYSFTYTLQFDYSYIKNIYFYNKGTKSSVVESIIRNIPLNEKILYFGSNTKDNWKLSQTFPDSHFICSKGNPYYKKSDQDVIYQIANECRYEKRILIATKVLDNGVNIIDKDVKHIFVDMVDIISLIQCIGRKRCVDDNDYINLYIRNYNKGNIYYILKNYEYKINMVDDFKKMSKDDFREKYLKKKSIDYILDPNFNINEAKYFAYKFLAEYMRSIVNIYENIGYKEYVCNALHIDADNISHLDAAFESKKLTEIIESNINKKMFGKDKEDFKNLLFGNVFTPKKVNYAKRGISAANGVLNEDNLPYEIFSIKDRKIPHADEYYWIIARK